jgi:hypothetical protein
MYTAAIRPAQFAIGQFVFDIYVNETQPSSSHILIFAVLDMSLAIRIIQSSDWKAFFIIIWVFAGIRLTADFVQCIKDENAKLTGGAR